MERMDGNVVIFEARYPYIRRIKAKKSGLWGISWYHRMFRAIAEVSHEPRSL
jgi:hypothetical protein